MQDGVGIPMHYGGMKEKITQGVAALLFQNEHLLQ